MAPQSFRWDAGPSRGPNAPEVSPAEWEQHRELLRKLYIDESMTLDRVMKFMGIQHEFSPTKRQYTLQLRKWGYFKNFSRIRPQITISHPLDPDPTTSTVQAIMLLPTHTSANATSDSLIQTTHTRQSHEFSIPEAMQLTDEELAATSTCAGSPTSTQGTNNNHMSSLSSIEDAVDTAQEQAPSVEYMETISTAETELCLASTAIRDGLLEQAIPVPEIFDLQSEDALGQFDMTGLAVPDPVLIKVGPEASVHTETNPSMKRCLPMEFLFATKPRLAFRSYSQGDLCQMKDAADFFSAARSSHDAFAFYSAICSQEIVHRGSSPTASSLIRAAIDVVRTATSDTAYAYVEWLMEKHLLQEREVALASTAEACLLHSHLGTCSAAHGNLREAAKSCHTAREGHRKLKGHPTLNFPGQAQCSGLDVVILINAILVKEHQGYLVAAKALQDNLSPNDLDPGDTIIGLLYGFAINLADDDFRKMLDGADEALWEEAPTPKDLMEFETTVLFCYLWTRWQVGKSQAQTSPQSPYRHSRLAHLEDRTGIRPLDALSALSAIILRLGSESIGVWGLPWRHESWETTAAIPTTKSTLAHRALTLCHKASVSSPLSIFRAFLQACAASTKSRGLPYSTMKYGVLVGDFVRKFADSHLSIELWQGVGDDPRLSSKPSRASFSSSLSPTMISAPRSSWSGYASFRSLHQRTKQMAPSVVSDELPSASSGLRLSSETSGFRRRWISLSSSLSSRSSIVSLMDVDSEDIIIPDDI